MNNHRMKLSALTPPLLLAGSLLLATQVQAAAGYADVAPILNKNCVLCHSGDAAPLGLRLDSYEAIRKGSINGAVVIAGDSRNSKLIGRLQGTIQPRMPMTGPPFLSDADTALIASWIDAGLQPATASELATLPVMKKPVLPAPGATLSYSDVAPIFMQRCVKCHKDNGLLGAPPEGLRLQNYAQLIRGGERVVVIPGIPASSELMRRITGQSRPAMPFDGPPFLSDDEIRVIGDWIKQGARDSDGQPAPIPVGALVRLQGRLTGLWALDGLPLELANDVRIKKRVSVGDMVRIRGQVMPNGRISVTRIESR